ncbi:MAG: SapC family protein [Pseudomonadota bacterium]
MPRHVVLNNIDHKDLRIITAHGERYGDGVMAAVTFPAEFRNVQAHYPIVFQKTHDGTSFQPLALFGFREGENLFLRNGGWDATYVPLAIERQPFLIGFDGDEPIVHLDLDSPRVSSHEGEPVFLPYGGMSEYLDRVSSMLLTIHEGVQSTPAFVSALLSHGLLEPFALDIERTDGSQQRLAGFYAIHEERLQKLEGPALEQLNRDGHLLAVYMAVASMSRLRDLIDRAEARPRMHA